MPLAHGGSEVAGAPSRFEEALIQHVHDRSSGGLEATDGRRRWQFFLDAGELVCTRSNVKSEQDAVLQPMHDDDAAMAEAQAVLRLESATKASDLTWKFHAGAKAPQRRSSLAQSWIAARMPDDIEPEMEHEPAAPDLGFDIGALIAEEVGHAGPAQKPKSTAVPPTHPKSRAAPKSPPHAVTPEVRLKELERRVNDADNYFEMLGLPWDAPTEKFRQAFTEYAREFHPDKFNSAPEAVRQVATEIFDRMRGAWEVIQNETERAKYTDRVIHGKKSDEEEAMEKVEAFYRAEANFKRGHAAFTNGRTVEAHNFFKQAVEDCPEEYEFLVYYGYTLFFTSRSKDPQMAAQGLGLIQRVLRENEKQARKLDSGWVLLGRAYRDGGDFNDALKAFKTAYELNPGNADAKRQYQRTKEQMDAASTPSGFLSRVFGKDGTGSKAGGKNRR
jgi:tetratricopeptide (TPR) repeat protein